MFAIFSIFSIVCFISWIPRIPFSVLMLQTCMDVAKNYGHVFMVSAIGGVVALAFGAVSETIRNEGDWLAKAATVVLCHIGSDLC